MAIIKKIKTPRSSKVQKLNIVFMLVLTHLLRLPLGISENMFSLGGRQHLQYNLNQGRNITVGKEKAFALHLRYYNCHSTAH